MSSPRNPVLASISAPSMVGRALLAILLMAGFYVVIFGSALLLFALPVALVWGGGARNIRLVLFAFAACWIPAFLLFTSAFRVRREPFQPEGRRLAEAEAPELFRLLRELASAASTEPPSEVYLTDDVNLSVTETAGLFGRSGPRVLLIGAPVLATATVEELRAGLAHELGHFAFGDTRLLGLVGYSHAAFRAVAQHTGERSAFADTGIGAVEAGFGIAKALGNAIVQGYARLFFWITRRSDRRAELAADQLAAKLVGPAPVIRLLEKVSTVGPLYAMYLENEVAFALSAGGIPTDISAGFSRFSERFHERGLTAEIEKAVREEKTDWADAHPALAVRIDAVRHLPTLQRVEDTRIASTLVNIDLEAWSSDMLTSAIPSEHANRQFTRATWAEMPRVVFAPWIQTEARKLAARLFQRYPHANDLPSMFAAVVRGIDAGELDAIAVQAENAVASAPVHLRQQLVRALGQAILRDLLGGALVERGAEIETSLGDPLLFRWSGTTVAPGILANDAFTKPEAWTFLRQWALALEQPNPTAPPSAAPRHALPLG